MPIRLRIEMRYGYDFPVGTMPSISLGAMKPGEVRDFLVNFDPIALTNGKYCVDLVLFEVDAFGNRSCIRRNNDSDNVDRKYE